MELPENFPDLLPPDEAVEMARQRIEYLENEVEKLKEFIAVASELRGEPHGQITSIRA